MVKCQQQFLKTVDLSSKPIFQSQKLSTKIFTKDRSVAGSSALFLTDSVVTTKTPTIHNLTPNRKIVCLFGNISKGADIVKIQPKPSLDEVCHKRAFSSSVIRIPYLSLARLSDTSFCVKPKVPPKTSKLTPKIKSPRKSPKKSALKATRLRSGVRRLSLNRTIKTLSSVKLEPPEVFVETPTGYQFVCQPEFSDDENDSSLVITISSDDSQ